MRDGGGAPLDAPCDAPMRVAITEYDLAERRLALMRMWQLDKRAQPVLCADILEMVGKHLVVGGLNALLRECDMTLHKALFVRLLTTVLDKEPRERRRRYSQLSKDEQLSLLAHEVLGRNRVRVLHQMRVYSRISRHKCRRLRRRLRSIAPAAATQKALPLENRWVPDW